MQAPAIVAVVPAHNAEKTIGECLDALLAAGFAPHEIIVVDDGSRDGTSAIAAERGVHLLRNDTAERPARARNRGAAAAKGEAILFVDADVSVHSNVRTRLIDYFAKTDFTGVIGAYDESPRSSSVVGRYRNLLHAYAHRQAAGEVPTFWTGLGAIGRQAFEQAGGFLSEWESIEDVEFGLRVTEDGGRILLDPQVAGKHLKDWTVRSMIQTDLRGRAMPWTRLLRSGRMPLGVLSTSLDKRISAAAVALGSICLPVSFFWPPAIAVFALSILLFAAANISLIRFFRHAGGPWFAWRAMSLHAIHHAAGLLGYARVMLFERT